MHHQTPESLEALKSTKKWQKIGQVTTVTGLLVSGSSVFSAIPAAKWFFQSPIVDGFTAFDSILLIGAVVTITGASIYAHQKSKYDCLSVRGDRLNTQTPVIYAAFTASQGIAMCLAFQFTAMMLAYYGSNTGISGIGTVAISATSCLVVSAICSLIKNYTLYQDQMAEQDEHKRESFGEWMEHPGRFKDAIIWDFLAPGVLASAASGFMAYILPKSTTAGVGVIALESIMVGGAVLALFSAWRIYKHEGGSITADNFERA